MNIFKRIFGTTKNEANLQTDSSDGITNKESLQSVNQFLSKSNLEHNTPELFKHELYDSLNRYYSTPDFNPHLNLTDENGVTYKEHEAFNSTFEEWKEIRSVWDRRSVLFSLWDTSEITKIGKWQIIERFVKDRYGIKGINFHENHIQKEDFENIRLMVSLSKLYRVMDSYENSLKYIKYAYEARPDIDIIKVEYATVLHLSDKEEDKVKSHNLMNEVIENKIKNSDAKEIPLLNYFVFSKDYIDSSVFATIYLNIGNCDLETWDNLAEEYYWCPNFRYEHAVFLSKAGESFRAIAKLNSLANEFPWFAKGVLANIDAIKQFRDLNGDPSFMSEEMNQMKKYLSMIKNNR
ncbi:hypothetical protein [Flavobacterium sp. S87F.05.LMB.W.Kidney.N]|uniref:hypothetical protein n=1 Tax=Flavobacterium sp. S87F.05.LMB.W.Kidney.N TaxID=1278758 RepID=UPI001064F81F|nr:hypothetical protein [Flavobacterium sp. S87F.05.LMB.W.Kidney.N]TDX10682.1 hypothetical protein EDB96_3093 [Flavobacterium sp. S87F.05.LMB.W.Kidney.N]